MSLHKSSSLTHEFKNIHLHLDLQCWFAMPTPGELVRKINPLTSTSQGVQEELHVHIVSEYSDVLSFVDTLYCLACGL